jgi:hypothetical protein
MTHPDKSNLPPKYFLFYKKAFEIIVQFHENQNKQNQKINEETTKYNVLETTDNTDVTNTHIKWAIGKMSPNEQIIQFNSKFNELFEKNMHQKPDPKKNEWFSKDEPIYVPKENVNTKNMGYMFDKIKETQNGIVKYKGVQNIVNNSNVSKLYDDDDNDDYVNCDPFSKLKFDDLRKVHKEQTVFTVSEKDFHKMPKYNSVDHFVKEREKTVLKPLQKKEAEKMLSMHEKQHKEMLMKKEYYAELKTRENIEKNKIILANFLQLEN